MYVCNEKSTPAQQTPKITKITNHKEAAGDIDLVVISIMLIMVMLPLMIMMSRMMLTRKDLIDHGLMLSLEIYLEPTGSILSRGQPGIKHIGKYFNAISFYTFSLSHHPTLQFFFIWNHLEKYCQCKKESHSQQVT